MSSDITFYEKHLKLLLKKFLEPDFHLQNDLYLSSLASHLSGSKNTGLSTALLQNDFIIEWIVEAISLWEKDERLLSSAIRSFILQLISFVSEKETSFLQLYRLKVYDRLAKINDNEPSWPPSIKLSYIKIFRSFLSHQSGLQLLVEKDTCNVITSNLNNNQTLYLSKEIHEFVCMFLIAAIEKHEELCVAILRKLLGPINTALTGSTQNEISHDLDENEIYNEVEPSLDIIFKLIDKIFQKYREEDPVVFRLIKALEFIKIRHSLNNYFYSVHNLTFLFDVSKILISCEVLKFILELEEGTCTEDRQEEFGSYMLSFFKDLIVRNKVPVFTKCAYSLLTHWSHCARLFTNKHLECFENKILILQVLPMIKVGYKCCKGEMANDDVVREMFVQKFFDVACPTTIRIVYQWRGTMEDQGLVSHIEFAQKAVSYVIQSKSLYSQKIRVISFQCFVYSAKDMICALKDNLKCAEIILNHVDYLRSVIEGISELIQHYHITWHESLESICVFQLAFEFLSIPRWDTASVIAGLKLMKISLVHYMTANMALLVDRFNGSASYIGPLLYAKLHDGDWQVRDSALEVIAVIAEMSNIKFPSLQGVLLDSDLISLVLTMSLNDGESFVRVTALQCVSNFVPVACFWTILEKESVLHKLITLLRNETEGTVRAEAIEVLTNVYKSELISKDALDDVYAVMVESSLNDLHWEVRLNTLTFWENIVENLLTKQGMIDNCFPEFTFSGPHRKIVALTDTEIAARLKVVMDELSKNGCLSVLYSSMSDVCDLQVAKKAAALGKKLTDLLSCYNVYKDAEEHLVKLETSSQEDQRTSSSTPNVPLVENSVQRDQVIDAIVESSDTILLGSIVKIETLSVNNKNEKLEPKPYISPVKFWLFATTDFQKLIGDREKWLDSMDSFSSLLNDMLNSCGESDFNLMDCY